MTTENTQRKRYESISNGFGITGLVLGIVTLLVSFIPCFGVFAFIFGVIAILISLIGLVVALKHNHPKGLIIGALLTSLLGCGIAYSQYAAMQGIAEGSLDLGNEFIKSIEDKEETKATTYETSEIEDDIIEKDEEITESAIDTKTPEKIKFSILIISVDNLRVRNLPSLDAEKIENLPINSEVQFLNEKSTSKVAVSIDNKDIKEFWYKIKTLKGNIGWIHGCCFGNEKVDISNKIFGEYPEASNRLLTLKDIN
jgi:hypothetical protein